MKLLLLLCLTLSSCLYGLGGEEPPSDNPPKPTVKPKKKCRITITTEMKDGTSNKEVVRHRGKSKDDCSAQADRLRSETVPSTVKVRHVKYDWSGPLE